MRVGPGAFAAFMMVLLLGAACGGGGGSNQGAAPSGGGGVGQPVTLTVALVGGGAGTVTSAPAGIVCSAGSSGCSASFDSGAMVTLTPGALPGSAFGGWSDLSKQCLGTAPCTLSVFDSKTITASFVSTSGPRLGLTVTRQGAGTVTSDPAGIDCGDICSAQFARDSFVTMTARPATGQVFTGWGGGACSGTDPCVVPMNAASAVNAVFETASSGYLLGVSVVGDGRITSSSGGIDCGTVCSATYAVGSTVTLTATAGSGSQFKGWTGACSGTGGCTVTLSQAVSVGAAFAAVPGARFTARPYLFKAVEGRLRASIAANDPEATGSAANGVGTPIGFLTLARAAAADRSGYSDIPTFQIAFAGWLLNDAAMQRQARDEAMAIVNSAPGGDSGRSDDFQHVEDRLLTVAATVDLAYAQFTAGQLSQVATWVNGTLNNWNTQNLTYWPFDDARNNYWQNGFLAHVIGGVASEGFNPQAASWRAKAEEMAQKFKAATTAPGWNGPLQSEGHYYAGYVSNALWAMELYDGAMGTSLLADSGFSFAQYLNLVMYQTRPHLQSFFLVGSEAAASEAPFHQLSLVFWHQLIHSGKSSAEAQHAKSILSTAMSSGSNFWARASKGFVNFYWNIRSVATVPASGKPDRMYTAPTPGAGLIGLRSSAGFQPSARASLMFANRHNGNPGYSHSNPDAPGFQWAWGGDWLVTDPEFYSDSGIMAEAGTDVGSDVSNIVTLAGQKASENGNFPVIRYSEHNPGASVPHSYVQIDAAPYWTSASVYRRDYVWLDDLQVVAVFDRIVGSPAKTWRLHVPAAPTISGDVARYTINGKTVAVRNLYTTGGGGWTSTNLRGSLTQRDVWRLSQADASSDYRSLKVLDVGGRVSAASVAAGSGYLEATLTIAGTVRIVRFFDDGSHASVR